MNLIIEQSQHVSIYTDMSEVMNWLGNPTTDYDWLITDIEGGWLDIESPCFMSGKELAERLNGSKCYFEWAVFSALPKGSRPSFEKAPFADGNPNFWKGSPKPQLKEALFEIVCWDSGATLFIGLSEHLGKLVAQAIPDVKDLNRLNMG